ncbi:Malonyl CoA-acyl carrier protein transacylase [Geodia barretti]|uniref:[acyl-carrier-protein] S-malonyltransferase n=1 Tax=Geodia barretti TaxID=519541 RepID=A0AA35WXN9_GEOBA|nr:Malonyl CoA-acyl carrier protein transacylase [Geodia barretti]
MEDSAAARQHEDEEADDSLGFPLSRMIFEGPAGELQNTANSQPAIMTVSIAAWRVSRMARRNMPVASDGANGTLTAHSLGPQVITALVAAGVLGFPDAVRLVRRRGELMNQASMSRPGTMAAILGLDEFALGQVCAETGVELANINTDNQIVISGSRMAVAQAVDLATARGARKSVPLPVSGAFHSSLMVEAEAGLSAELDSLTLHEPRMPIIANCDCRSLNSSQEIPDELVNGLCRCVQWKDSVVAMVDSGITRFVEFGAGGVLAGLIKRIDREVEVSAVADPDSIRKLALATD